jgi:hypothetical protein
MYSLQSQETFRRNMSPISSVSKNMRIKIPARKQAANKGPAENFSGLQGAIYQVYEIFKGLNYSYYTMH